MADVSLDMLTLFAAVNSDPEKAKRLAELQAAYQQQKDVLDRIVEERSKMETLRDLGNVVNGSGEITTGKVTTASGAGSASNYVCTDSSNNFVVQSGAC